MSIEINKNKIVALTLFDETVPIHYTITKSGFSGMFNMIVECPIDGEPKHHFLNKIGICDQLSIFCPSIRELMDELDPEV
jgi:hypothetical protein